jgi:hypothetical protein
MMLTRRVILGLAAAAPLGAAAASLPEQSAGIALDHAFPDPNVSYLLTACATTRAICSRWAHPMDPVTVGSLVKPFTALAYGETCGFRYPAFTCSGARCWLPQGHGRLEIGSAIAHSCNAYFLELAREVKPQALQSVIQRFGLSAPDPGFQAPTLIGLGTSWRISPFAVARAYSELIARSADPGVRELLAGMALSAQSGTGRGAGRGAYVKTGTAGHDGYVIALYPSDAPRFNLLVRVHGVPGAQAAWVCGKMRRYVPA